MLSKRLQSLDALRGLIMVLMALDHANAFIAHKHSSGEYWGGSFPTYPDTLAFMTRFVTHLSAPGFAFLMGVGMVLFAMSRMDKGWGKQRIRQHFVIRGVILMVLQLTIINLAWSLGPNWNLDWYFGVLFALGGSMIIGSLFLWLKPRYLLVITITLFIGNEMLVPEMSRWGRWYSFTEHVLMVAGGDGRNGWWVNYPIIQWLEMVMFGMVFGHMIHTNREQTLKWAGVLGIVFLLAFAVIRYVDGFGNIRSRDGDNWIDVLNLVKYPPSLAFSLLTMGVNLILLSVFERIVAYKDRLLYILEIIGRVPLMFYIIHLYLYALIGKIVAPDGMNIASMYPYWLLGLLILLRMCWKYGQIKRGGFWLWRYL